MTIDEIRDIIRREVYAIVVDECNDGRPSAEIVGDTIGSAAFHIHQQLEREKTMDQPSEVFVPINLGDWSTVPTKAFLSEKAAQNDIDEDYLDDEVPRESIYKLVLVK